jgi:MoaA/NifB/PqqE/SkfB family radical SAM enzyme
VQGTSPQLEPKYEGGNINGRVTLPESICFRVTRYCNARCGFCLAPPDGAHPHAGTLLERVDWVLARGVRSIHFCGGEPTIHPAMTRLIDYVHTQGGKSRLTTNGIAIPDELISMLRRRHTETKVSLHGDREYHNRLVGCDAFDRTTENLRRLVASGVRTSVQTTVVAGGEWVVQWMAAFCRKVGVKRLSILPFIPRGSGYSRREEYELTAGERAQLHDLVRRERRALNGRLDLRWLDFTTQPVTVVEADGTVVIEGATESTDRKLGTIPVGENRNASED